MNSNIFRVCFLATILLLIGNMFAQVRSPDYRTFPEYADLTFDRFNISCKMPSNFIDMKSSEKWGVRPLQSSLGYFYTPVIQSKNKECVVLYPFYPLYMNDFDMRVNEAVRKVNKEIFKDSTGTKRVVTNESLPRGNIIGEITTAFGIPSDSIDLDNYLTVLAGKEARNMFNADSVFLYDILLDKPYKDKYVYCKGMVISKRNRPAFLIKWFFTEKGKKKEKEYIELLNKTIWYDELINEID